MRIRLFPSEPAFFDFFNDSVDNTVEGARLYLEMCEKYEDPKLSHKLIRETEHKGDTITHDIIRQLNTTFVTPFDREDIHALAVGIDDIMDFIEAASDLFVLHQIEKPTATAVEQAKILVRITGTVASAVHNMRKFKGLDDYFEEIQRTEKEGDQIHRRAVAQLFSGHFKAMEVLKWKDLYEEAEHAIDACERVANTLEQIVLKHA
jgi:predicted phosphate transport protein (TIGR00153 family)